jgi:hypothetical protein
MAKNTTALNANPARIGQSFRPLRAIHPPTPKIRGIIAKVTMLYRTTTDQSPSPLNKKTFKKTPEKAMVKP